MTKHHKTTTTQSDKKTTSIPYLVPKQARLAQRVGIFSGTFDPVHKGHTSFALQAIVAAGLDKVIFLPEIKPRHKHDVTHVSHRLAMIRLAIKAYPNLDVLELPDKQLTIAGSLPRIIKEYPNDTLLLLIGTDVLGHISVWPHVRALLKKVGLVVAVRGQKDERHALRLLAQLPIEPTESHVLTSNYKLVASRDIRDALRLGDIPDGTLATVTSYAKKHWIYASVAGSANKS